MGRLPKIVVAAYCRKCGLFIGARAGESQALECAYCSATPRPRTLSAEPPPVSAPGPERQPRRHREIGHLLRLARARA